jgi:hypothetical protein
LAERPGGATWRSGLAEWLGGVAWRSGLAEWLGGVAWRSGFGGGSRRRSVAGVVGKVSSLSHVRCADGMREPGWCGPSDGSQRSPPDHGERPLQGRGDLGAETQAFGLGW